ncbi:MAG: cell division protein ZapA [Bacteroidota bacterium]
MAELSIKIRIGNREYPMRVKAEDEERIRKTGKVLNEKIKSYQNQFGIDDIQDLVAMVAFDCVVEKLKNEESAETSEDFALREVTKLNRLISDTL